MAVERGEKVLDVRKRTVCKGCGHEVFYTENDIQKYSGTDYGGGPDGRWWIVCPCGHQITLKSW